MTAIRGWTWEWLAICGLGLIAAGCAACAIALTVQLLPHDVRWLGMTARQLCDLHACRIVHFMVHDRISFGGSLVAAGLTWVWIAARPLARGERWAFGALAASGAVGFLSFLSYLGFGYLDAWHERATLLLLGCFVLGLWRCRAIAPVAAPPAADWDGPGRAGHALLLFTAAGMIAGGLTICVLGMTAVFVPQDLEFMRVDVGALRAISDRLVPLIAHDRAGFGGGLVSGGLAIGMVAWRGVRPGRRELWWVLSLAGAAGFGTAILVHPFVGYLSASHLAPAVLGAATFTAAMALLYRPMR
ncbi:MAG: hypothetical protein ACXWLM_05810 [Myxococcales bacterium]